MEHKSLSSEQTFRTTAVLIDRSSLTGQKPPGRELNVIRNQNLWIPKCLTQVVRTTFMTDDDNIAAKNNSTKQILNIVIPSLLMVLLFSFNYP